MTVSKSQTFSFFPENNNQVNPCGERYQLIVHLINFRVKNSIITLGRKFLFSLISFIEQLHQQAVFEVAGKYNRYRGTRGKIIFPNFTFDLRIALLEQRSWTVYTSV